MLNSFPFEIIIGPLFNDATLLSNRGAINSLIFVVVSIARV